MKKMKKIGGICLVAAILVSMLAVSASSTKTNWTISSSGTSVTGWTPMAVSAYGRGSNGSGSTTSMYIQLWVADVGGTRAVSANTANPGYTRSTSTYSDSLNRPQFQTSCYPEGGGYFSGGSISVIYD